MSTVVLKTFTQTFDLATATGSGSAPTVANEIYKVYVALNANLVAASVGLNAVSQGPCYCSGLFLFDHLSADGFYLPGTLGVLRANSQYTSSDNITWWGRIPTSRQKAFVTAAVRNDSGATVSVQLLATVDYELPK